MNLGYNQNVPNPPNSPSADVPLMKTNTNSINSWVQVDHHGFGDNLGGYHTIIHQDNQTIGGKTTWNPSTSSGTPAAIQATKIANIQQTFSMLYTPNSTGATADTQLFSLTGAGGISQLTGNNAQNDGWQWIGGTLIQWGRVLGSHGSDDHLSGGDTGTVTFKDRVTGAIPFPNACFEIICTPFMGLSVPSGTANVVVFRSPEIPVPIPPFYSPTSFTWAFVSSSSSYTGFSWIAIGN